MGKPSKQNLVEFAEKAPILSKLASEDVQDRAWAAATISNLCPDEENRQVLLKNNVVEKLLACLQTDSVELLGDICEALRSLALNGGAPVTKEMIRKGALAEISRLLPVAKQAIAHPKIASNLLFLFWQISEHEEFEEKHATLVLELVFAVFDCKNIESERDLHSAGQCLLLVTEQPNLSMTVLLADKLVEILQSDLTNSYTKICSAGALFNLMPQVLDAKHYENCTLDYIETRKTFLCSLIIQSIHHCLNAVTINEKSANLSHETIQEAAELLANLFSDYSEEEMVDENGDVQSVNFFNSAAVEMLGKLVEFANLTSTSPNVLQFTTRSRCLSAIANILDKVDQEWITNNIISLQQLWIESFNNASAAPTAELDGLVTSEYVTQCVNVLFIIVKRLNLENTLNFIDKGHLETLGQTVMNANASEKLRIHCVMTLGILAQRPGMVQENEFIGILFMQLLTSTTSVEIIAEVLNCLFDVYADEAFDYDCNFKNHDFTGKLAQMYSKIKTLVKSVDKRKDRMLRSRGDEAVLNLQAFIEYKRNAYSIQ